MGHMMQSRLRHPKPNQKIAPENTPDAEPGNVPAEVQARTTNDWFGRFAAGASGWLGSRWAFSGAALVIVVWAATGPLFHY
jgi:hypothetical protein